MLRTSLVSVFAAAAAVVVAGRDARACTVCGCGDPVLTVQGTDAPEQRDLRVGVEARAQQRTSGADPLARARGTELRASAGVAYTPNRWVSLVGQVPWVLHHSEAPNLAGTTVSTLGDVEVQARFHVYRDRRWLARHALSVLAAVELPTSPRARGSSGAPIEADEQAGSGSWDLSLGLAYVFRATRVTVYASALARWDSPGWDGYQRGASVRASLLPLVPIHRLVSVAPAVDLRASLSDSIGRVSIADTGGVFVYASPTVLVGDPEVLMLRATVQVPLGGWIVGAQRESPALVLGVSRGIF